MFIIVYVMSSIYNLRITIEFFWEYSTWNISQYKNIKHSEITKQNSTKWAVSEIKK